MVMHHFMWRWMKLLCECVMVFGIDGKICIKDNILFFDPASQH